MDNKDIVTGFFQQVTNSNMQKAFELLDDNVIWWIPGSLPFSGSKTKEQYFQVVSAIQKGFPTGFSIVVTSLIAEGNKVAAEAESSGRHVNGKDYNNKYHFLFEIASGKISSVKEYMDMLHLYQLIQP